MKQLQQIGKLMFFLNLLIELKSSFPNFYKYLQCFPDFAHFLASKNFQILSFLQVNPCVVIQSVVFIALNDTAFKREHCEIASPSIFDQLTIGRTAGPVPAERNDGQGRASGDAHARPIPCGSGTQVQPGDHPGEHAFYGKHAQIR
ncbi:hypothetical protein [Neptunicoccus sediminis]|uniref:hypothetical protein n=1 Tax=Neptunicoccus sediminis TaxID=1892596 RepID=UPI0012FFCC0F|nr:hypothetical protein [Neptunicoccus sediminis]